MSLGEFAEMLPRAAGVYGFAPCRACGKMCEHGDCPDCIPF